MTCIAAIIDTEYKKIVMGGDSAGVEERYHLRVRKDPKVFIKDQYIIGYTTSFRMGQLLRYGNLPPNFPEKDPYEFMITVFIPQIRDLFKSGGFSKIDDNVENAGTFIIGFSGKLFTIYGDYQVAEMEVPFSSCGCGEPYALGSLYESYKSNLSAEKKIENALNTAEYFSAGVRSPFTILSLKY